MSKFLQDQGLRKSLSRLNWARSVYSDDLEARTSRLRARRFPPPSKARKVKSPFERLTKSQQELLKHLKTYFKRTYYIEEIDVGKKKPKMELWVMASECEKVMKLRKPTLFSLVKAGFLTADFSPREDSESWRSIPEEKETK